MASKMPSDIAECFFDTETLVTPEKLANVKLQLMSRDPASMISAVSWIKQNLDSASDSKRECLVEALIENDTLTYLCENLSSSYGYLFKSMLQVICKFIPSKNFHTKNFTKLAVTSIIPMSFLMAKKMEPHQETLTTVTFTLYKLLDGASRAQVPLENVYDRDPMIAFLERLDPKRSTSYDLRLNAAKTLCLIMSDLKFPIGEATQSSLFKAFKDSLLSMGKTVMDLRDAKRDEIIQTPLEIICSMCSIGTRFCNELEGEDFAKEITCTMIDTVIPHFRRIKFEREVYQRSLRDFIDCLGNIFELKNSEKELANVFAAQGYLKYFLEISVPRKSVCSLVSKIISKLSEDHFAQSDSPEKLAEFRKSINEEILELPSDADISTILRVKLTVSDGFLILLYYHSHKSHEFDLVPLSTIVFKLISMTSNAEVKSELILKATWFLFMVSSRDVQTDFEGFYSDAVTNLAKFLQRHDLRKCYTHDRVLLDCSLNCEGFPLELRYEIARLWLDFDGEIEPLLESPKIELIDGCLVDTIAKSSEKLVNRALKILVKLKSNKRRWANICERVWERLPEALAFSSVNTMVNLKELLKIAQGTKPGGVSLEIYEESAATLARALATEKLGNHLDILLLQYVNTLLKVALERNIPTVVESCAKHAQLLATLRDRGFSRENWVLSGFCMDLMVNILESQEKFDIRSSESEVVKIEPLKMLVLLARSNYELSSAAVRLLTLLLKRRKKCIISVALDDFENAEAADKATSAWYRMLHQLFPKKQMEDWHLIFLSLISVLKFCDRMKLRKTLQRLCDYSCTYDLVRHTIDHEYANPMFFTFLECWLHYACKYKSMNMVLAENAGAFENLRLGQSEFEEIIEMITNFKERIDKSSESNPVSFFGLEFWEESLIKHATEKYLKLRNHSVDGAGNFLGKMSANFCLIAIIRGKITKTLPSRRDKCSHEKIEMLKSD